MSRPANWAKIPDGAARVASFLVACLLFCILAVRWTLTAVSAPRQEPTLVRIYYDELDDLGQLTGYDLLEVNNLAEHYVLAYVDSGEREKLQEAGWRAMDEPQGEDMIRRDAVDLFANGYHTVSELFDRLAALDAAHPDLLELVPYGESYCLAEGGCEMPGGEVLPGYDLLAVRVTNEATPGSSQVDTTVSGGGKPIFFLMANIHAREITTPEIALSWLESLVDGYGNDPDITWLLDFNELWVVPTVNPDGHWIVELGDTAEYGSTPLLHRKNANQDVDKNGIPDCEVWPSESYAQFGVDLNRNHSYGWQPSASLSGFCSAVYPGPTPASEPEVAQLQELIRKLVPDQRGPGSAVAPLNTQGILITLHSYSELVLRPWGYVNEPAPNETGLKAIGDKFASYNGYLSCQPGQCLYEAAGTSDDWAYGELGIPAFTFEIGQEFMPPYSVVANSQWPVNRPAFLYAAKIARSPYLTVLGPDARTVDIQSEPENAVVTLTAVIDDLYHGNEPISAAEYSIDQPSWSAAATFEPMEAIDGAFDSSKEEVAAQIDAATLSLGQHLVYVRGLDASGNWGVTSASFVLGTAVAQNYLPITTVP